MSYPSIQYASPQNFVITPTHVAVVLSSVGHIPASQVLSTGATLTASQLLAPLVVNMTGYQTVTLPDAISLARAYGDAKPDPNVISKIPFYSQIPSTTVQVGDVFTVPVYALSTNSGATFNAGTGGDGNHIAPVYASNGADTCLKIQFTAVGTDNTNTAYHLS